MKTNKTKEKEPKIVDYHNFVSKESSQADRKNWNIGDWYINAAECHICGDIPRSRNRHDYRSCKCGAISVDGGSWYLRRIGNLDGYIERSIKFDDIEK